jgi:hypothetical protein
MLSTSDRVLLWPLVGGWSGSGEPFEPFVWMSSWLPDLLVAGVGPRDIGVGFSRTLTSMCTLVKGTVGNTGADLIGPLLRSKFDDFL